MHIFGSCVRVVVCSEVLELDVVGGVVKSGGCVRSMAECPPRGAEPDWLVITPVTQISWFE